MPGEKLPQIYKIENQVALPFWTPFKDFEKRFLDVLLSPLSHLIFSGHSL